MQDLVLPALLVLVVAFTIWGCASGPSKADERALEASLNGPDGPQAQLRRSPSRPPAPHTRRH